MPRFEVVKIGVISDTHDYLDPRIPKLFAGVEHILHAGDIGKPILLLELREIAPVTAVGGNTDDPGYRYQQTALIELGRRRFLVRHIVHPHASNEPVQDRIARDRPDVVVFGHSHRPFCETVNGVLYLNPGYAGKPRFGMERSVAILHCDQKSARAEYLTL